jgi:signal transduction histidine kinase
MKPSTVKIPRSYAAKNGFLTINQAILLQEQLELKGLEMQLKELFSNLHKNRGLYVKSQLNYLPNLIHKHIEFTLYNIVLEALNNIIEHAEIITASVSLEIKNEAIMLEIADKGKGFSIGEKGENNYDRGLFRMRQNCLALGGRFNLNSGIMGTQISVEIPLKNV